MQVGTMLEQVKKVDTNSISHGGLSQLVSLKNCDLEELYVLHVCICASLFILYYKTY